MSQQVKSTGMLGKIIILVSFVLRDISKSRVVLILTILSLSVAFSAIFLSGGVLNGFQMTMENGTIDTGGHLTIISANGKDSIKNIESEVARIRRNPNVEAVSVRSYGNLMRVKKGESFGIGYAAIGIDPNLEGGATRIPSRVVEGRFLGRGSGDDHSVVLGLELADFMKGISSDGKRIHVGEKIHVRSRSGNEGEYVVVGIVDTKYFHPNWSIYFTKKEMDFLDKQGINQEIAVKLHDPNQLEDIRSELQRDDLNIRVITWKEREGYVFNIITATKFITDNITRLVSFTVFLVMSATIFINVFQRRRQIGILKSMGASNRFIVAIYVLETLVYAVFSYTIGLLLFILVYVYSDQHPIPLLIGDFKIVLSKLDMLKLAGMLLVISVVGSFIPSYVAARTRIADVLRNSI